VNRNRINDQITSPLVHLIDEVGQSFGTVTRDQALYLAFQKGLDLVEVGPGAAPPVVKTIDYGKFLYQQQKKEQRQKGHGKVGEVKQIRLGVNIFDHDLQTKANHGREFLSEGHKIRVSILLKGRERMQIPKAYELIERFSELVEGRLEAPVKAMGNLVFGVITKK
jgi:translation initiation factor IF-3